MIELSQLLFCLWKILTDGWEWLRTSHRVPGKPQLTVEQQAVVGGAHWSGGPVVDRVEDWAGHWYAWQKSPVVLLEEIIAREPPVVGGPRHLTDQRQHGPQAGYISLTVKISSNKRGRFSNFQFPIYFLFLTWWPLLGGCQDQSGCDDRRKLIPSRFSELGKSLGSPVILLPESNRFHRIQQEVELGRKKWKLK